MSTHDPQRQLQYLLDEIKELGGARHLSYVVQDATGLFVPGFAALPAATILGKDSWKTKAMAGPETWRTGDLIALTVEGDPGENPRLQRAFFSPVCEVTFPLLDISPSEQASRFSQSFRLAPHELWTDVTVQFAVLPWEADDGADFEWSSEDLSVIGELFDRFKLNLSVTADIAGRQIELQPDWGPSRSLPIPATDGARFPLNHARELVAPFLFRLSFARELRATAGEAITLERQPVTVNFHFDEQAYGNLYREAGLGAPRRPGISVIANALPVANLDLTAWPAGDKFSDFVREAGMKPLGMAGIFHFKRVGEQSVVDPLQSHANVFSAEIDRDGMVLNRYGLPGEENAIKDKQLLLWMTLGSETNGARFKYKPQSIRQPMEKASEMLVNAQTVLPCFGGAECYPSKGNDLHRNLMLNVAAVPQMFAFREGLVHAAQEVVSSLGYDRVTVAGVEPELRVVGGVRRRVTVVYLDNRGRKPLLPQHLRALTAYLTDRSPIGTDVVIEERANRD
jgi:hypothetical protein